MDGSKAGGRAIEGGRNVCVLFDGHGPRHVTRFREDSNYRDFESFRG